MAKNVFRPIEIVDLTAQSVFLDPPKRPEKSEVLGKGSFEEEYRGPTADQLRREADLFQRQWIEEKKTMIEAAEKQAAEIIARAEKESQARLAHLEREEDEGKLRGEAELAKRRDIVEQELSEERKKTEESLDVLRQEAREQGYRAGIEEGYQRGKGEVDSLVERAKRIVGALIGRRESIIREAETQLVDLVLAVARKVVKVVTDRHKGVVTNNVMHALRKLNQRTKVEVRVNLDDLEIVEKHKKEFLGLFEKATSLSILEDPSIERGGCLVDTDFGQIDARIFSQLREIEGKIQEASPMRAEGNV